MANVHIDYLKPGMVLNSDVRAINGRLLLLAETELTEKHICIFKAWGITEVDVKGVTEKDVETFFTEQVDPVILIEAEKELKEIFRHTNRDQPAMRELFRSCTQRKARHESGQIV
ncbi:MAG: hypothetical protein AB1390_00795 [Nitrospirota bacterium]